MTDKKSSIISSGVAQMFFSTFSFAMANVFVKKLSALPVMEIIFLRCAIAGILCVIGLKHVRASLIGTHTILLISRGVAGTLALMAFFLTLKNIPLASATVIQYLSPIFTAIIGIFFLRESVRPLQWVFYVIAFSGVLLINRVDARVSLGFLAIGILSAFGSGVAYNIVRKLREAEHPLVIILYFQLVGVALTAPFLIYEWKTPIGSEWWFVLFVGVFSQFGQVFLTNAFSRERAATVAIIVYTGLGYAIAIGWLYWGERQSLLTFLGMALVVLGVALSVIYSRRIKDKMTLEASIES
ncbi:MAG: DMT family transporter [Pyrinomonadaceae bacterium]